MAVSYKRLWKLLVDKEMSKSDLRKKAEIAPNTMTKLRRDEEVSLTILSKICKTLNADFGDIVEYIPDAEIWDLYDENRELIGRDHVRLTRSGILEKKEIIDSIVEIESQADATLQTLSALKDEIATLLEENQTLRMENEHLRERLDDQMINSEEIEESGGLTKSRLNLENIYEDGFHVCNMFYGQRRVEDEPCAFCLEVIYGER